VIKAGESAATIASRLQTQITGITTVIVQGSGTDLDPWSFEFVTATQVNEQYQQLELASGGGTLSSAAKVTRTSVASSVVAPAFNDRQLLAIPSNASKITLKYGSQTTATIDVLAGPDAIATALNALSNIVKVSVVQGRTATDPWIVSLIDATKNASGAFERIEVSVTSELSAAYLSTLGAGSNIKIQSIDFGTATRGVINYGRHKLLVDSTMSLATINALFDNIEGDLNGSSVAVTEITPGTFGNWTATFTALVTDQAFERILFSTEDAIGSPATAALASQLIANRQQSIVLPATAATIYYGDSGIDINAAITTAAALKAKLESLTAIRRVEVTGLGTVGNPWLITLVDADVDADGAFLLLSSQTFTQSAAVIQTTQGGSTGNLFSYSRTLRSASSATQSLLLADWQTYATVHYGNSQVNLLAGMTAAEVEVALESMDSIRDVWVSGTGTVTITPTLQKQSIPAADLAVGTTLKYSGTTLTLAADDIGTTPADQITKLQTKLRTITAINNVIVTYNQVFEEYQVEFPTSGALALSFNSGSGDTAATPGDDISVDPWSIVILDADKDQYGNDFVIESVIARPEDDSHAGRVPPPVPG
jgi:hypothetical protein